MIKKECALNVGYIKGLKTPSESVSETVPALKPELEQLRWLISHFKHRRTASNLRKSEDIGKDESEGEKIHESEISVEDATQELDESANSFDPQVSSQGSEDKSSYSSPSPSIRATQSTNSVAKNRGKFTKLPGYGTKRPWANDKRNSVSDKVALKNSL
mgnify:FL=1